MVGSNRRCSCYRPYAISYMLFALKQEANGLGHAELQEFVEEQKLLIRVKAGTTIEEKVADRVVAAFAKGFPGNQFVVDATTEIGPTVGQKLQHDAMIAVGISFAGII